MMLVLSDFLGISVPGIIGELNTAGPITQRRLRFACSATAVPSHFHRGSNEVQRGAGNRHVITCPNCLASDAWKRAVAAAELRDGPAPMFDAKGNVCC